MPTKGYSDEIGPNDGSKSSAISLMEAAKTRESDVEPSGIDEPTTFSPTFSSKSASDTNIVSFQSERKQSVPDEIDVSYSPSSSPTASSPLLSESQNSIQSPASNSEHESNLTTGAFSPASIANDAESAATVEKKEKASIKQTLKSDGGSLPIVGAEEGEEKRSDFTLTDSQAVKEISTEATIRADGKNSAEKPDTKVAFETGDLKIQPNQLYVNWKKTQAGNVTRGATNDADQPDRVESILDGIIHALDTRVNQELPSEPRDPGTRKITDEQIASGAGPSSAPSEQPTSRRDDQNHESHPHTELPNSSPSSPLSPSLMPKENRKADDDEESSFQLPPIPTGYITNLNPIDAEYHVHRNQHQHLNYHSNNGGNKILTSEHSGHNNANNQNRSTHTSLKPSAFGNTVGRIQVSSKIGFSDRPTQLLNIGNLPRPSTHSHKNGASGASSFLVSGDENERTKPGHVEDDSPGAHVEIITAKTPFLDTNVSSSDSYLINLSPTTLKVGSAGPSLYSPNGPAYESLDGRKGSVVSEIMTPVKPKPSFPVTFTASNNQWKVVTQNHRPKSKLPKLDDVPDSESPVGQELTRRSGFVMDAMGEEERNVEQHEKDSGTGVQVSSDTHSSAHLYESSQGTAFPSPNHALGQENPVISSTESSHAIIRSPMSPFLKRNGNMMIAGESITSLDDQSVGTLVPSPSQSIGKCSTSCQKTSF